MLRIICEGERLDLSPNTEISLNFENPMLSDSAIPVPFSLSYELPLSQRNRQILGFPERATTAGGFKGRHAEIYFAGIVVATGMQAVEEASDKITANFNAVIFPDNIRKYLCNQNIGGIELGNLTNQDPAHRPEKENGTILTNYSNWLKSNAESQADIIAAPIAIRAEMPSYDLADSGGQPRVNFINLYTTEDGYFLPLLLPRAYNFSKILLAFRVTWLLDILFGEKLMKSPFRDGEWPRLFLQSIWHPEYQVKNNGPVYTLDRTNRSAHLTFADFMPQISANEFTKELLRIPCASMYVRGDQYVIEYNRDIFARRIINNSWDRKIIGTPRISLEPKKTYSYGYSGDTGSIPQEGSLTTASSIRAMYVDSDSFDSSEESRLYKITTTGQVFEVKADPESLNKCKYSVVYQDMGGIDTEGKSEDDDEIQVFDNVFKGTVPQTNLRRYFTQSHQYENSSALLKRFYYMPEIDPISEERSDNLVVGLFWGMKSNVVYSETDTPRKDYPYMSHCNRDAYGNRLGNLTLQHDGDDGLMKNYHKEFKEWIERDKIVIKADILIDATDISRLDLRDKFLIKGKLFFVKSLSVTLTSDRILPADVEFIEM